MSYYKTLQDASRMLSSDNDRRKTFVLISEGIGKDMAWLPELRPPSEGQDVDNLSRDPTNLPITAYHDYAILDMMRAMRRANIATYVLDPRGEVTQANMMKECSPSPGGFGDADPCSSGLTHMTGALHLAQEGLEMTADATGGFAVTNSDDFERGVERIVSDLDNYYLLGFYPKDTERRRIPRADGDGRSAGRAVALQDGLRSRRAASAGKGREQSADDARVGHDAQARPAAAHRRVAVPEPTGSCHA